MRKLLSIFIVSVLLLGLAGCSLPQPTLEQFESGDYGAYPDNYQELVREKLKYSLYDYYSAHIDFQGTPRKCAVYKGIFNGGKFGYGWIGFVMVNAKNRMGGYTGYKEYFYTIKNGRITYMGDDFHLFRDIVHFN